MPETMSHQPEDISSPDKMKTELDAVYDHLIKKFDKKNPEEFTAEERAHVVAILASMIVRFGAENVWDGLITHDADESHISFVRNMQLDMNTLQEMQTQCVTSAENGDPDMQASATFGMFEPGYIEAIKGDQLAKLATKGRVDSLLVGAMSYHSADEFGRLCHSLSKSAIPTVLDKSNFSLDQADPSLVRTLHADATQMPLPDKSQDMIFTNLLLPWLSKEGKLPSGEIISKVFQEMARVVKDDGMVVMAEMSPTSIPENCDSWLTILLMEASLKDLGFKTVTDHETITFRGQLDKKRNDMSQIVVGEKSEPSENGEGKLYYPFSFIVAANRDEHPLPMEDLSSSSNSSVN